MYILFQSFKKRPKYVFCLFFEMFLIFIFSFLNLMLCINKAILDIFALLQFLFLFNMPSSDYAKLIEFTRKRIILYIFIQILIKNSFPIYSH